MTARKCFLFLAAMLMLSALPAFAGVLYPDFTNDRVALDVNAPGLGDLVYSRPWTHVEINWNDNWGNQAPDVGGDYDFNDLRVLIDFFETNAVLSVKEGISEDLDMLWFQGSLLRIGQSVTFTPPPAGETIDRILLIDATLGRSYLVGHRNPDGDDIVHAQVLTSELNPVPEPATIGAGLIAIAVICRKAIQRQAGMTIKQKGGKRRANSPFRLAAGSPPNNSSRSTGSSRSWTGC